MTATTSLETLLNSLVAAMHQLDQRVERWAQIEVQRGGLVYSEPTGLPNGHLRKDK